VPLLAAGLELSSFLHIAGMGMQLKGRTDYLAMVNWSVAIVRIGVNYLLIKEYGVLGACFGIILVRG
jgi:O-antigen/teichoic acid export membrane protein